MAIIAPQLWPICAGQVNSVFARGSFSGIEHLTHHQLHNGTFLRKNLEASSSVGLMAFVNTAISRTMYVSCKGFFQHAPNVLPSAEETFSVRLIGGFWGALIDSLS